MNLCVFLGPTLPLDRARRACAAEFLPPVRQGDVYRVAALYRPRAIGIIDGYFNQVPAVWHKEILWALEQGIQVAGAASMGALRAAELEAFGMRGVGRVFEAYRDGFLAADGDQPFEDDDEVAVVHGPPETGYVPVSEAMVNIRCTLAKAAAAGVISETLRAALARSAKALFYPQRSYDALLSIAVAEGAPQSELEALRAWLPEGRVDQKRDDALALLRLLPEFAEREPEPGLPEPLEHTSQWDAAMAEFKAVRETGPAALDELRLQGGRWFELRRRAVRNALAEAEPPPAEGGDGFTGQALTSRHRDPERVDALFEAQARARAMEAFAGSLPEVVLDRHLTALLEQTGELARLAERAEAKRRCLGEARSLPSAGDLTGLDELQLEEWYFERHLGVPIPDDLEGYVARLGFAGMDDFIQALIGEYHFVTRGAGGPRADQRPGAD